MIIEKSIIAPKLAKLKTVLPNKVQGAAVNGVLFKGNCLMATNLEIGVMTPLEVEAEDSFVIPARAIELIDNLPDGPIEIFCGKNLQLEIKAQHINNKFFSYDPDEYPELPGGRDNNVGTINSMEFEKAVKSVLYAIDANNVRANMSGVYFDSSDGVLNLVGTDSHRLAWYKMPYNEKFSFIAPKTTVQKLLSLGIQGDIEISYDSNLAVFKAEEYTVYTRLLEGTYVPYRKVFLKHDNSTIINRSLFIEGLRRCMLCMEEKNKGVVKLHIEGEKLRISSDSTISQYLEEIDLEAPIDEPITIAFNGIFLVDCMKSFDCENIELSFGSGVQPMVVDDGQQSALILPIRTN